MSYTRSSQIPNEPIVVAVFDGGVTAQDVAAAYESCNQLMQIGGFKRYFLIGDLSKATGAFGDILKILQYTFTIVDESISEKPFRFKPLFVGADAMVRLYVDARRLHQFGAIEIPLFTSFELALNTARSSIKATQEHKAVSSDSVTPTE